MKHTNNMTLPLSHGAQTSAVRPQVLPAYDMGFEEKIEKEDILELVRSANANPDQPYPSIRLPNGFRLRAYRTLSGGEALADLNFVTGFKHTTLCNHILEYGDRLVGWDGAYRSNDDHSVALVGSVAVLDSAEFAGARGQRLRTLCCRFGTALYLDDLDVFCIPVHAENPSRVFRAAKRALSNQGDLTIFNGGEGTVGLFSRDLFTEMAESHPPLRRLLDDLEHYQAYERERRETRDLAAITGMYSAIDALHLESVGELPQRVLEAIEYQIERESHAPVVGETSTARDEFVLADSASVKYPWDAFRDLEFTDLELDELTCEALAELEMDQALRFRHEHATYLLFPRRLVCDTGFWSSTGPELLTRLPILVRLTTNDAPSCVLRGIREGEGDLQVCERSGVFIKNAPLEYRGKELARGPVVLPRRSGGWLVVEHYEEVEGAFGRPDFPVYEGVTSEQRAAFCRVLQSTVRGYRVLWGDPKNVAAVPSDGNPDHYSLYGVLLEKDGYVLQPDAEDNGEPVYSISRREIPADWEPVFGGRLIRPPSLG